MGLRGELYSTKFVANDRTYFFNVKENIKGDVYLNVVESKIASDTGRYIRQSIIVYPEDLGQFVREFQKALDFIKLNAPKQDKQEKQEN
ncbi:MAG: DUF3276 family protein [Spirochaetales bacterium]|nr:DUF3276 family protein [Spirochaetales bacterium]